MKTVLGALAALLLAAPAAGAADVHMAFQSFEPGQIDALTGETVTWTNGAGRTHTVTDPGVFDSGDVPDGAQFRWTFNTAGTYVYGCRIHPGMTGEVDVAPVVLDSFPPRAVPAGTSYAITGRTADPWSPVTIQRDGAAVTTVTPAADGSFTAKVRVVHSAQYRAVTVAGASRDRRLLVSDRKVIVHRAGRTLHVEVAPALPGARVLLEQRLRERFGWWPVASARLDYISTADFPVRGGAPTRVVLVARDGWTPVSTSTVLRFPPARHG